MLATLASRLFIPRFMHAIISRTPSGRSRYGSSGGSWVALGWLLVIILRLGFFVFRISHRLGFWFLPCLPIPLRVCCCFLADGGNLGVRRCCNSWFFGPVRRLVTPAWGFVFLLAFGPGGVVNSFLVYSLPFLSDRVAVFLLLRFRSSRRFWFFIVFDHRWIVLWRCFSPTGSSIFHATRCGRKFWLFEWLPDLECVSSPGHFPTKLLADSHLGSSGLYCGEGFALTAFSPDRFLWL